MVVEEEDKVETDGDSLVAGVGGCECELRENMLKNPPLRRDW